MAIRSLSGVQFTPLTNTEIDAWKIDEIEGWSTFTQKIFAPPLYTSLRLRILFRIGSSQKNLSE
jgi:hypothetical protein